MANSMIYSYGITTLTELKDKLYKTSFYLREISRLRERIKEVQAGAYIVTPSYSTQPAGGGDGTSKQERAIVAADAITEYIEKDIALYEQALKDNMRLIDLLDDGEMRSVMQARFLYSDSMAQIADEHHYSDRQCYRIYRQALQIILDKITKRCQ